MSVDALFFFALSASRLNRDGFTLESRRDYGVKPTRLRREAEAIWLNYVKPFVL